MSTLSLPHPKHLAEFRWDISHTYRILCELSLYHTAAIAIYFCLASVTNLWSPHILLRVLLLQWVKTAIYPPWAKLLNSKEITEYHFPALIYEQLWIFSGAGMFPRNFCFLVFCCLICWLVVFHVKFSGYLKNTVFFSEDLVSA